MREISRGWSATKPPDSIEEAIRAPKEAQDPNSSGAAFGRDIMFAEFRGFRFAPPRLIAVVPSGHSGDGIHPKTCLACAVRIRPSADQPLSAPISVTTIST